MTGVTHLLSLLILCFIRRTLSLSECTDMVSLTFSENITHGPVKTADEIVTTAVMMEDAVGGSNVYYVYIRPICYHDNTTKYNCLGLKILTSYGYLKNMSDKFCWDNELHIDANCKLSTIRIVNESLICQLEYDPITKANKLPTIAKLNLKSGRIIATREFIEGKQSSRCLRSRDPSWVEGCHEKFQTFSIQMMMSETGLWISYPKSTNIQMHYVHLISIADLRDISTRKEFPLSIKGNERAMVICNKIYVMSLAPSLTITRAFDLQDARNSLNYSVQFAPEVLINKQSWFHYNPKLHKVYFGRPGTIYTTIFDVNRCTRAFPNSFIPELKSTFMWALEPSSNDHLLAMIETITGYFSILDINKLSDIADSLITCPAFVCNKINIPKHLYCRVKSEISSLVIYSNYRKNKNEKRKRLQVEFSMAKILEDQTLKSISLQLHDLKSFISLEFHELKARIDAFRSDLGTYFLNLATFDSNKAQADVNSIYQDIDKYTNEFSRRSGRLSEKLQYILLGAMGVTTADAFALTKRVALSTIALMNPFTFLSSGIDLKQSIDELAVYLTKFVKLAHLSKLLSILNAKLFELSSKLKNNFDKNTSVRRFIFSALNKSLHNKELLLYADAFLVQYTEFDSSIGSLTIAEISSTLELIVDEGCNIITEGQTVVAATIMGLSVRNCYESKIDVNILIALIEEIASFQDSLLNALVSFVRSTIAKNNAESLRNIENPLSEAERENDLLALQVYTLQFFVSSKVHKLMIVHDACNLIEYIKGGIMPDYCEKAIENPYDSSNYGKVKAFPFDREMCNDQIHAFVNIPSKFVSDPTELSKGTVDLNSLFNGNETNFQIPDRDWLVHNGWVPLKVVSDMMVLKRFEIYIPVSQIPSNTIDVSVSVRLVGNNAIVPSNTTYTFNVPVEYNFRYSKNEEICENKIKSPYHNNGDPPVICLKSDGIDRALVHPSVFAHWKIKAVISDTIMQNVSFKSLNLKAGVSICVIPRGEPQHILRPWSSTQNLQPWTSTVKDNLVGSSVRLNSSPVLFVTAMYCYFIFQ